MGSPIEKYQQVDISTKHVLISLKNNLSYVLYGFWLSDFFINSNFFKIINCSSVSSCWVMAIFFSRTQYYETLNWLIEIVNDLYVYECWEQDQLCSLFADGRRSREFGVLRKYIPASFYLPSLALEDCPRHWSGVGTNF